MFNLSSLVLTKSILSNGNSLQITFFPKYLLNNFSIDLSIDGQFSSQKIQINDSISIVKFPFTGLYDISLLINGKEISSFKINVITHNHKMPESFFDCKNVSNTLQCFISNVCLSSKGLSFFGYESNIQVKDLSFIIDPMKDVEILSIFAESNFTDHSFSNIPAIYADLQSRYDAFFHYIAETLFPFVLLFDEYNITYTSKIVVLKRKPNSIFQYFPILNATVQYMNENKCYKKLIIGFPRYDGYFDQRFKHFLDPKLYTYKYRKIWRKMHENFFVENKNDKKIDVLFINRPLSTHRSILNYDQIMLALKSNFSDLNIVYADFSNVSLYNQIRMSLKTDIFITLHGSAVTHLLLLNDNSLMIEIMPYLLETFLNLYMNIANLTKVPFVEFHTDKWSCFPAVRRWVTEYERNPKSICNGKFRHNLRNQNIALNETEINLMLKIIRNHIQR